MEEAHLRACLVTGQTIEWLGIGSNVVGELSEMRVTMVVLDERMLVTMGLLYRFQPL
jgi:hypothetical protein